MYSSNNKQYIFRQSSGKVWNFFYDEKYGLCYSMLVRQYNWSEPVTLQKNIHPVFFMDMDYEDNFHILFQDKQGNIAYSEMSQSTIKTTPILNSKTPSEYDKFLFMLPFKNNINFFYVIQHENSMLLAYQVLSGETVSAPRVIDYITNSSFPYSIIADKSGSIYAFYQVSDGKYLQLGYKKYLPAQKVWGEFTPITRFNGNCDFPKTIIDSKNIIHICYQRRTDKQYELVYQQKVPDKNIWSNETVIFGSAYSFNEASVAIANGNIVVYWVRDDTIYYSSSTDYGSTWSKPVRYPFSTTKQLMCMCYKTNNPYESDKVISYTLPGSYINGFKLAFYQEANENSPANLSADDLRNMIVDGLKMLRNSVEELKEADLSLREDLNRLMLSHQSLEKELIKNTLKMNTLENEITQMKFGSPKLDEYRNSLEKLRNDLDINKLDIDLIKGKIDSEVTGNSLVQRNIMEIQSLKKEFYNLRQQMNKRRNNKPHRPDDDNKAPQNKKQ